MRFPTGTVTLLFTDVEDGIRLWEADREAMADASARHNRLVRDQIEIAGGRVFRTVNTVRSYLERIRDKTGARRRTELVRYAIQAGIESTAPSA
jgi:class 3 adenylate cyclase